MKRLIAFAMTIVCLTTCLFVFAGCDPIPMELDVDKLQANTVKIELVYYDNNNPKTIQNLEGKKQPTFNFDKTTLIATLDDSRIDEFINDIGEYEYLYFGRTCNEPVGKTLILYQSNGDILVLFGCVTKNARGRTCYLDGCILFDKDGKYIEYIGDFGYVYMEELESKYFNDDATS